MINKIGIIINKREEKKREVKNEEFLNMFYNKQITFNIFNVQ